MLTMLFKFTHQVAVCCSLSETTHCPPQILRFDFNPSTALLAWINSVWTGPVGVGYGCCWYVCFLSARFSVNKTKWFHISKNQMKKKHWYRCMHCWRLEGYMYTRVNLYQSDMWVFFRVRSEKEVLLFIKVTF